MTKAEYADFLALKEHAARLERQVEYLLEQMRLSRHRQFGASSEKSEYDLAQLNLFNEAEVMAIRLCSMSTSPAARRDILRNF